MSGVAILGASGLVGASVARHLLHEGHRVVPVARRFAAGQRHGFPESIEVRFVELDVEALADLLRRTGADVVVNCVGVLQDTARGGAADVHAGFAERLLEAIRRQNDPPLLVQISIPGEAAGDETGFARTKRAAEAAIRASGLAHAILRPGFVVAPVPYGGSALLRAFAALPLRFAPDLAARPFAPVHVSDIARTVAFLAVERRAGRREVARTWDLAEAEPRTLGEVAEGLRARLGGPAPRFALPTALAALAARLGDLSARLGWTPPLRSTTLAELRRGVDAHPAEWIAATRIRPLTLAQSLSRLPGGVEARWFARLFLLKPVMIATLSLFWIVSGAVPLLLSFDAARAILASAGFPPGPAFLATVATSLADIAIGLAIAVRRTCRAALAAGIGLSLVYLLSATLLTPLLWLDPVGSLVKTVPAILLMLVAVAILDDR